MPFEHSAEIRAQVHAKLIAGGTCEAVGKEMGLSHSTVGDMRLEIADKIREYRSVRYVEMLDATVTEIFQTQIAIQQHARSPEWLEKQGAASLATFSGVSFDKGILLFQASAGARQEPVAPALEQGHVESVDAVCTDVPDVG